MKKGFSILLVLCLLLSFGTVLTSCTLEDLEGIEDLLPDGDTTPDDGTKPEETVPSKVYRNTVSTPFDEAIFVFGANDFSYIALKNDGSAPTCLIGHYEIKKTEWGLRIFLLVEKTCINGVMNEISDPYYIEDSTEPGKALFYEVGNGYIQIDETVYDFLGGIEVLPDADGDGIPDYFDVEPSKGENSAESDLDWGIENPDGDQDESHGGSSGDDDTYWDIFF